ncbi:6-phosphogluconolactonase [Ascidiaceihabitans sp.]|nr:6-phosphogluconolactonase [Paracoccaceae bacterium]MDB4074261.1 6-phosphogluconolactonase [Ascidiaceihabitans sp.]MDB9946155.1 6-phosphogluconolactonase [Ascidiaceihabitans sp.]HCI08372.1 6-phosphogluconolactonase [Sulfitobacter sp.]
MSFQEYSDREMLIIEVAQKIVGDLKTALLTQENVSFVVPGGTTPGPIFDILCAADIEWNRVHVMLSDERWVPDDNDRSNAKLLRDRLLVNRAAAAKFTPFYVPDVEVADACKDVSEKLASEWPISVLVLGMGADMHTASLFPQANGLDAALRADADALLPIQAEGQEQRVTLSAPVLNSAISKHIVIFGDDKRAALDVAKGSLPEVAPVAAVLDGATIHWAV